jgi:S-adenosylmethionine:tRNA ribosyltransferase-isomerase
VLLVRRLAATRDASGAVAERWTAMAKANRKLKRGSELHLGRSLRAFVEQPADDEGIVQLILGRRLDGSATASPGLVDGDETLAAAIEAEGGMPLPPYIDRPAEPSDRERYQTVFARVPGAVAAPTAGLHLSRALLDRLHRRARVAELTLHVGPGTFRPVTAESLDQHAMHAETYDIPAATAEAIAEARERGAPVVAVGTTVVRALEAAAADDASGQVRAGAAETQLLIQPGYRFRVVDALLTNFHLPRSTLLALVYAFAGAERVAEAYRTAIAERYRFYSYGDAMFLPRATPGDSTAGPR